MIILFYGQPASGKTTLANELYHRVNRNQKMLEQEDMNFVRIDGDRWRDITQNKNYSKEGRLANLKGAFDMALYLENEGFIPILSFVTPYDELREYLKGMANNLIQIYLEYEGDRGRNDFFAKDFEESNRNDLYINTSYRTIDDCVDEVIVFCAKHFK